MDVLDGGTLQNLIIKRKNLGQIFTEDEIITIMTNIFRGVCYMHDMHVIHRDIKPGFLYIHNIFRKYFVL